MADDFLFGRIGQMSGPARQWRNYAQGSLEYDKFGSGSVVATFDTGGGIVKGAFLQADYNEHPLTFRDNAATIQVCGSGYITPGWVPCWLEFKNTLTVYKLGSGEVPLFLLIGTGLPPFV